MRRIKTISYNEDKNYYIRLEEEETLIGNGTVFFANQLNFWGQTTLILGLLKLENFTQLRQKILR